MDKRSLHFPIEMLKNRLEKIKNNTACFLLKRRHFLNGTVLEYVLVFLVFSILTVIYTNFIALHIDSQLFVGGAGDGTAGYLWYNFADHSLNPSLGLTDMVNYPYGEVMGGAAFITYMALWLPIRALSYLFGPFVSINLVTLWGFIAAGIGCYWLIKRLTGSVAVALFAGFAAAFVPYNIYKSTSHLPFIFCIVFILIAAAFIALWSHPSKKRGVLLALSIALAFYTNGYFILLASVMLVGMLIAGLLHSLAFKFRWPDYWKRIRALLVAAICLLILVTPIVAVDVMQKDQISSSLSSSRGDIEAEFYAYRSFVIDFILPPSGNPLLSKIDSNSYLSNFKYSRSNSSESMMYVGFVLMALNAVGLVLILIWLTNKKHSTLRLVNDNTLSKYVLVGFIIFVTIPLFLSFMFSPEIEIFGHTIPVMGKLLLYFNISLWRVMSRFFIPLHAIMAIFGAFTLWIVLQYNSLLRRLNDNKAEILVLIVVVLTLITACEYWTDYNRPSFDLNKQTDSYIWVKKADDISVIAEFPMVDPLDENTTQYVTSQLYHGKKIVNIKEASNRRLTNTLGSIKNSEAIDFSYIRGARAVIVHDASCNEVTWGVLMVDDKGSNSCVYSLDRPVTADDVFVEFENGFGYFVNNQTPATSSVRITKGTASLNFIDDGFKQDITGAVNLVAKISPLNNGLFNGSWTIKQDGKIIATGEIINSVSNIDVDLLGESEVDIEIKNSNGAAYSSDELQLENIIATGL